jgi:Tfp pilus assembly protein FimV
MSTMTLDAMFAPTRRPAAPTRPAPSASALRLTRRGRVVVLLGALLLAFAIGVFVTAAGSVATQDPAPAGATDIVQVGSGDTLWDIASARATDGDVRAMMLRIEQLNSLQSSTLQAGQRLVVPAS